MHLRQKIVSFFILFLIGILFPTISYAVDICEGYDTTKDPTKTTVLRGVCYYAKRPDESPNFTTTEGDCGLGVPCATLPTCSVMTAQEYYKDSNSIGISDEVRSCPPEFGGTVKCCALADQSKSSAAPPPPCITGPSGFCNQVNTGLGNIQVQPGAIVGSILSLLLGISGGIASLLIIFSGYRIIFANADPEKLKAAREMMTSAIIGLLFIIFSTIILRLIGVDILHLPGIK